MHMQSRSAQPRSNRWRRFPPPAGEDRYSRAPASAPRSLATPPPRRTGEGSNATTFHVGYGIAHSSTLSPRGNSSKANPLLDSTLGLVKAKLEVVAQSSDRGATPRTNLRACLHIGKISLSIPLSSTPHNQRLTCVHVTIIAQTCVHASSTHTAAKQLRTC